MTTFNLNNGYAVNIWAFWLVVIQCILSHNISQEHEQQLNALWHNKGILVLDSCFIR